MKCHLRILVFRIVMGLGLCWLVLAVGSGVFRAVSEASSSAPLPTKPAVLIAVYCSGCHSDGRAKVDLSRNANFRQIGHERPTWRRALAKLRSEEMPPPMSPELSAADRAWLIQWIELGLAQAEAADKAPIIARRLRRVEYVNTIRDLVGVSFAPGADFPADDDAGWERVNGVPELCWALYEDYVTAAERIVDDAFATTPAPIAALLASKDALPTRLAEFVRRAYRRPVAAVEIRGLVATFDQRLKEGLSVQASLKETLETVLTSPHFLHHVEPASVRDDGDAHPPNDKFALASRLSYLLWNSMPDDELLALAEKGDLHANLEPQVRRMLTDVRVGNMARDFMDFWLHVRDTASLHTGALERAMVRETELFATAIMQEDRSVLEFLDSDSTFANGPLAQHYGLAGVEGEAMRRVPLAGSKRGGLVTQASILALTTSDGRTSPVRRGKWVLDNLLGTPPPAPPSGLLSALANGRRDFPPGTGRQLLEQHRSDASCQHCHSHMDGLGFTLENFDAVGAWRTHDEGDAIDAAVVLPSGEALNGPGQLKAYLLARKDLFWRCLRGKLLSYALGRKLDDRDWATLEETRLASDDYRFSRLVVEVVTSMPFQNAWLESAK